MSKLFLVGGAVRDELMGKTPHDYDFVLVGSTFEEADNRYGPPLGDFPVFMTDVEDYGLCEVALARKEKKKWDEKGHKAFEVFFDKDTTLEEDLFRRDFTVNAMAKDLETEEIIDPYGGREDIKHKVLRCVNPEAFIDDPLRVFRLARFSAKLLFTIDPKTLELAKGIDISSLPKERIWKEFIYMLESKNTQIFFLTLHRTGHLKVILPEIESMIGLPHAHHTWDVFEHTMNAMRDDLPLSTELYPEEKFAILLHDVGKTLTQKDILPHHYKHDKRGVEIVKHICKRLGVQNRYKNLAVWFTRNHMRMHEIENMTRAKLTTFVENLMRSNIDPKVAIKLAQCDSLARFQPYETDYERLIRAYEAIDKVSAVSIVERGFKGPKVGQLLHEERVRALHTANI